MAQPQKAQPQKAQPQKAQPAEPGKMVIFTAAAAPSLQESGMMEAPTYVESGPNGGAQSEGYSERALAGSHLTVPFRQAGPGGFSLVTVDFAPGLLLPRHSHSSDCLYYIIEGQIVMGQRELGPGDGFFLPADQPYTYSAGPKGVKVLEFRHETAFDMQIHEKDMARYREKTDASMAAAASGGGPDPSRP